MNIVKRPDQYDESNVLFCDPIKNNVMNDGNFIRILYSTQWFTMNGIYLLMTLHDITCEKYYLKYSMMVSFSFVGNFLFLLFEIIINIITKSTFY